MEQRIEEVLKANFGRGIAQCTEEEIQKGLLILTKQEMANRPKLSGKKKVYYISAEFLIGKLLSKLMESPFTRFSSTESRSNRCSLLMPSV